MILLDYKILYSVLKELYHGIYTVIFIFMVLGSS